MLLCKITNGVVGCKKRILRAINIFEVDISVIYENGCISVLKKLLNGNCLIKVDYQS